MPAPSSSPPEPPQLLVVAAGMSPTPLGRSVGAAIRNTAAEDAVGVSLTLEFADPSGQVVGRARERLAYCPASAECLWGTTFTADAVPGSATEVRIAASADAWEPATRRAPFVPARRRADGAIEGAAPPDGTVYVVSIVAGTPRAGAVRRTTASSSFVVPADLVPPASGEAVRAVFYAEALPAGD